MSGEQKLPEDSKRKFAWTVASYYYLAMLACIIVFFAGMNLGIHGILRATSPDRAADASCLTAKLIDPAYISPAEQRCRKAERDRQIREGTFQGLQGFGMAVVAVLVFSWHFQRVRQLELELKKR